MPTPATGATCLRHDPKPDSYEKTNPTVKWVLTRSLHDLAGHLVPMPAHGPLAAPVLKPVRRCVCLGVQAAAPRTARPVRERPNDFRIFGRPRLRRDRIRHGGRRPRRHVGALAGMSRHALSPP